MALPAPNLDDRRFQELVNDAKKQIQQRNPSWTDHNVSDPGVTLIELFAWMTDQVVYRLNRVPDRNYVKFLELLGIELFPASPAAADVTFWLSAAMEEEDDHVEVAQGSQVMTPAQDLELPTEFVTTEPLDIVWSNLISVKTGRAEGRFDESEVLKGGAAFSGFSDVPQADDHILFGLADAMPRMVVRFDLDCHIEGVGVDPDDPPLVWEAWTEDGDWVRCDTDEDTTGGLNRAGHVVLHLPRNHAASVLDKQRAGWVRCRALDPLEGQPGYTASPQITAAGVVTVGGNARAINAREHRMEIVDVSEGVPGQRLRLAHQPVLAIEGNHVVEVATDSGWEAWTETTDFADHGPDDKVFTVDEQAGEIVFGPAVWLADGTARRYGAVPPKDAAVRIQRYRTGGGREGNVAPGAISQLKMAIPRIRRVKNRHAASGGVDTEDLANAKIRGPMLLRSRNRAVTVEDYEVLAKEAVPSVARIRCVEASDPEGLAGGVRVLVVPHAKDDDGQLRFEQLVPNDDVLRDIAEHLDTRRPVGARVVVEPPVYQGITIAARVQAKSRVKPAELQDEARAALFRYFNPLIGGPDRAGWPFGRPIQVGEVYAVIQALDGVEYVQDARLFAADPITGDRGEAVDRIELGPNALAFSYEHQVRVESA